ncbi:uncharacterized protein KY384_007285 [Bacidia gigantensis]|uniref:uncharacterized protein n=1 Tax=Bacidia gigantensis TaxID=2732470 RepID=UPI001D040A69|nr:uncharacterized protein KY384_007285 [Bacidia gigantensis]KAG8528367.1 hypothetical protein KY384_007285 [Bacidia gigantensis]
MYSLRKLFGICQHLPRPYQGHKRQHSSPNYYEERKAQGLSTSMLLYQDAKNGAKPRTAVCGRECQKKCVVLCLVSIDDLILTTSQIHSAENAPDEDSTDDASDEDETDFAYVLGSKTHKSAATHPPAEIVQRLWQVYVENVDPLTKVVHVPSLQRAIEKAITDVHRIPKGFEALMFAIYSMAILSLTDTECKETLGDNRATLLPQYVAATKTALSRARFMSSTSVVVLQALMLHILSIRDDYEPRAVWSLTGAAIRIAEGMGMRHDGTLLGLSPFETEIYRRIWWQLKMHDFKASELAGQAKFRDFEIDASTPKKPANVNDSDLYPSMTHAAPESEQLTDMIWITFRCDLASFAASQKVSMQKQGKAVFTSEEYVAMDDLTIKDGFIKKMQDMIETKYLRYCDPTDPLQLLTLLCGRAAANLVRFMAHHPRRWANMDQVPAAEQEFVWSIVIQLMEQFNMMRTSPQIRRFAWNAPYFIQWHAVIHILDTLRAHPLRPDAAKAWQLIGSLYEHNEAMLLSLKRPILVAVGNLCLKAWSARAAALARENRPPPKEPDYIAKLREQRQAAKVRREAALAKKRGMGNSGLLANNVKITDQGLYRASSDSVSEDKRQQFSAAAQAPNSGLDDAYWLSDGMNNDLFNGGASDPMNLDSDAILAQASWTDTPNSEVIDWGQWDSWFGSLDPRPNAGVGVN